MVVSVEADDGHPDLRGADDGGGLGALALLDVPEGVLDDDDGVVDEHAHPQGEAAQGQHVQRIARRVEGDERRDDGDGDGQGDDERRPPVEEEQEDEDDGQDGALPGVVGGPLRDHLDHVRHVHDRMEGDVGRKRFEDGVELFMDGVADDGRVGARLLVDQEEDALLALDAGFVADVLEGILDLGEIAQIDGLSRGGSPDDRAPDIVQGLELPDGPDKEVGVALDQVPGRHVGVRRLEREDDPLQGQAARLHGGLVHVDEDLPDVGGEDRDRGDAVDALETRLDLVLEQLLQLEGRHIGCHAPEHDRELAEAEFHDQGIRSVGGEIVLIEADLVPDVLGGEVEVRPPLEFGHDGGDTLRGHRSDLLDAVDRADDLLQRFGDGRLDVLRGRPRVCRDDGDRRELDVGEEVQPQPRERDAADDDQDEDHHGRRDAAID